MFYDHNPLDAIREHRTHLTKDIEGIFFSCYSWLALDWAQQMLEGFVGTDNAEPVVLLLDFSGYNYSIDPEALIYVDVYQRKHDSSSHIINLLSSTTIDLQEISRFLPSTRGDFKENLRELSSLLNVEVWKKVSCKELIEYDFERAEEDFGLEFALKSRIRKIKKLLPVKEQLLSLFYKFCNSQLTRAISPAFSAFKEFYGNRTPQALFNAFCKENDDIYSCRHVWSRGYPWSQPSPRLEKDFILFQTGDGVILTDSIPADRIVKVYTVEELAELPENRKEQFKEFFQNGLVFHGTTTYNLPGIQL